LASPLPGLPLYPALHAFVGAITVIGLGRFGYLALSLQRGALHTPEPIGFAAFVILAELLPVKVPRRADELTVSTTFAFALLITSGLPEAVVAQTAALVIADVLRPRRSRAVTSTSRRARSRWRPPARSGASSPAGSSWATSGTSARPPSAPTAAPRWPSSSSTTSSPARPGRSLSASASCPTSWATCSSRRPAPRSAGALLDAWSAHLNAKPLDRWFAHTTSRDLLAVEADVTEALTGLAFAWTGWLAAAELAPFMTELPCSTSASARAILAETSSPACARQA
jgi:hypothetical protein